MGTTIFTPFTEKELIPKEEKLEIIRKEKSLVLAFLKRPAWMKKDFVLHRTLYKY